jgi:hypothetical protein
MPQTVGLGGEKQCCSCNSLECLDVIINKRIIRSLFQQTGLDTTVCMFFLSKNPVSLLLTLYRTRHTGPKDETNNTDHNTLE